MEEITLILMILSIVLYVTSRVVKNSGIDFLTAIVSLCTVAYTLMDGSIEGEVDLLIFLLPSVFIVFMSFISLAFGDKKKM